MLQIAIYDDHNIYIKQLDNYIHDYFIKNLDFELEYNVDKYMHNDEFLTAIKNGKRYDIIFLDIDLGYGVIGTDLSLDIKIFNPNCLIIYFSSYKNKYQDNIIQAEPFRYLHKPIQKSELISILDDTLLRLKYSGALYTFKSDGYTHKIKISDIKYIFTQYQMCNLIGINGQLFQYRQKLNEVEQELCSIDNCFIRISKSYLVNFYHVDSYCRRKLYIDNTELSISYSHAENTMQKYNLLLKQYGRNRVIKRAVV